MGAAHLVFRALLYITKIKFFFALFSYAEGDGLDNGGGCLFFLFPFFLLSLSTVDGVDGGVG